MTLTDAQVLRIAATVETFAELYQKEGRFCFEKSTLPDMEREDVYTAIRNLLMKRHSLFILDLTDSGEYAICTLDDLRESGAVLVTDEEFDQAAEALETPEQVAQYLVNKVDKSKLN